jgi:dCMP deaminase
MIKEKYLGTYMKTAKLFAEHSYAKRKKVGAVIVKNDRIISIGYNGMPAGWDNDCEDLVVYRKEIEPGVFNMEHTREWKTKPEVLHAESNAIAKLARSSESGDSASMFITCAPCMDCAKMIYQSGIKEVFYGEDYRSREGIDFLNKCGLSVKQLI